MYGDHNLRVALNKEKNCNGFCETCGEFRPCNITGIFVKICDNCLKKKKKEKEAEFNPKKKKE